VESQPETKVQRDGATNTTLRTTWRYSNKSDTKVYRSTSTVPQSQGDTILDLTEDHDVRVEREVLNSSERHDPNPQIDFFHYNGPPEPAREIRIIVRNDGEEVLEEVLESATGNALDLHELTRGLPHELQAESGTVVDLERTLVLSLQNNDLVLEDAKEDIKRIPIPNSGISENLAQAERQYLLGSSGILAFGLLLAAMAAHRFTTPLRQLAVTAREVGEGQLGLQVTEEGNAGEVGVAITAFNKMSLRLRHLDEQTRTMQERAYLSELGEIANGLAHTIRNPLNTLGLSVEQLILPGVSEDQSMELANTARQQIRRIDQWIRSFLAFASQGVAQEENLDFGKIIQDVVLEAIQDGSKAVDLDMDLAEDVPQIPGVVPEMRAVLQALVVNAVEASPTDGLVTIRLKVNQQRQLCIEVEDNGSGVDEAIRDKLFTPHITTKATGSGMGLFLAGRIISSRYRGEVSLLNRQEGGTTALITIPLDGDAHA